jgi:hypothetical protein
MKVLIISLPRTGSSNLQKKISEENNLKLIYEPYNPKGYYGPEFSLDEDNIIIKTLFLHPFNRTNDLIEWFNELSRNFDETILLSRKNLKECAESWAYFLHNNTLNKFSSEDPYIWELTPNFEKAYESIIEQNNQLIELSKKLNIDIKYYEDLYQNEKSGKLRVGNKNDIKKTLL